MSFANKTALGLQGLGDSEVTDANGNPVDFTYVDPTFVGPPLSAASPEAQANQATLLAAQNAVISGAVGVPSTPAPQSTSGGMLTALLLLAGGFLLIGAFKR